VYTAFASGESSAGAEVYCPEGSRVTGGGIVAGPGDDVTMSTPIQAGGVIVPNGGTPTGWFGSVFDGGVFFPTTSLIVSVLCAS
jgi:hypothetical protein